jgi:hypothetical protein
MGFVVVGTSLERRPAMPFLQLCFLGAFLICSSTEATKLGNHFDRRELSDVGSGDLTAGFDALFKPSVPKAY